MIELAILAAAIGVAWWKWDVITAWLGSAASDVVDDDMDK